MSNYRSAERSPSHVDLDAILAVLRDHPEAVAECRIAFALLLDPTLRGRRALERASGLWKDAVMATLSPARWGLSPHGLIQTVDRGKTWTSEGREIGLYRLPSESGRERATISTTYKSLPFPKLLVGLEDLENLKKRDETKDVSGPFAHRFSEPAVKAVLDPALDLWTRSKDRLGSEGWRVAMLTGLLPIELTAKEWAELAGGKDRAKRLALKLESFGWEVLTRTGRARATRYTLDWDLVLGDRFEDLLMDLRSRYGRHLTRHAQEQIRITRPMPPNVGRFLADAMLAELDGTETAEHREGIERAAKTLRENWALHLSA